MLKCSNFTYDLNISNKSGVKEYWLVYPYEQSVHQFVLHEQAEKYELVAMFSVEDKAGPQLFPNFLIDLAEVFAD